jgi:hypothetical protein
MNEETNKLKKNSYQRFFETCVKYFYISTDNTDDYSFLDDEVNKRFENNMNCYIFGDCIKNYIKGSEISTPIDIFYIDFVHDIKSHIEEIENSFPSELYELINLSKSNLKSLNANHFDDFNSPYINVNFLVKEKNTSNSFKINIHVISPYYEGSATKQIFSEFTEIVSTDKYCPVLINRFNLENLGIDYDEEEFILKNKNTPFNGMKISLINQKGSFLSNRTIKSFIQDITSAVKKTVEEDFQTKNSSVKMEKPDFIDDPKSVEIQSDSLEGSLDYKLNKSVKMISKDSIKEFKNLIGENNYSKIGRNNVLDKPARMITGDPINVNNIKELNINSTINKNLKIKTKEEKNTMSNLTEKLKDRSEKAAIRTATNTGIKLVKKVATELASKYNMNESQKEGLIMFLESPLGSAFLKASLGIALDTIPNIKDRKGANIIAEELQISAMAEAGDVLADAALNFLPVITEILDTFDSTAKVLPNARVAIHEVPPVTDSEHEDVQLVPEHKEHKKKIKAV